MPKKGSRKVQFEIKGFTVDQTEDGGWLMRVVQEGLLDGLSDVAGAIEEAKAQAPNVVVAAPLEVLPIDPDAAYDVSGIVGLVPTVVEPVPPDAGTVPQDTSDPSLGSSGNLPFPPEGQPDAEELHKRVRRTQGKEK